MATNGGECIASAAQLLADVGHSGPTIYQKLFTALRSMLCDLSVPRSSECYAYIPAMIYL